MYRVLYLENGTKVNKETFVEIVVADLERALALSSMLQKISTPEVSFGGIIVEPLNQIENETEEK